MTEWCGKTNSAAAGRICNFTGCCDGRGALFCCCCLGMVTMVTTSLGTLCLLVAVIVRLDVGLVFALQFQRSELHLVAWLRLLDIDLVVSSSQDFS